MSTPPPVTRARTGRAAVIAALTVLLGLAVLPFAATPASADLPDELVFDGRGWGHGRGMSQYGAQGYATKYGWSSAQILDHYYGGTTAGTAGNETMRIRLRGSEGKDTRITVSSGELAVTGLGAAKLPAGTKAIHLSRKDAGGFDVYAATSTTCTATDFEMVGNTGATSAIEVRPTASYTGKASELLRLCTGYGDHGPGGTSIWYPGALEVHTVDGAQQTVNITTIEQQLRSVVPNESPSSWAPAALQAQAVAARSYALAGDNRWAKADTCDTIFCQVYVGHFKASNGSPVPTTATSTDQAIKATEGVVRRTGGGAIARTEFSSTTGGYTAGGTFPAVEDLGDAISPRHTWQCTVAVAPLEAKWGNGGSLTSFRITERNGLGAMGGRVMKARLGFSNGTATTRSGAEIRSAMSKGTCTDATGRSFASGLLSDWFDVSCLTEAAYIDAVHELFVRRSADGAELDRWCGPVRDGNRETLTKALSVSDEWAGVQISQLYRKILDREAEAGGRAYWLGQVERGLRIEQIAAQFYGSAEYFGSAGSTNRGYVESLYLDLLGRAADAEGRDHWATQLDAQRITRQAVADSFYASIESRTDRVDSLFNQVLGRPADPDGRFYWTRQLLTLGDVTLAAWLAASQEFYDKAVS